MRIELTPSAWKAEVLPLNYIRIKLERKTRFELATLALARRCSTPEPLPHAFIIHMWSAKTIFCILSQMTHFVKGFGDIFGETL